MRKKYVCVGKCNDSYTVRFHKQTKDQADKYALC